MPRRSYSGNRATTAEDGSPHWLDRGGCVVYVSEGKRVWELEEPPSARCDNEPLWDWGANCDGAHRLGLAILTDALASRERALVLVGAFVHQTVRALPHQHWHLWADAILSWAREEEERRRTAPKGPPLSQRASQPPPDKPGA